LGGLVGNSDGGSSTVGLAGAVDTGNVEVSPAAVDGEARVARAAWPGSSAAAAGRESTGAPR
jgi:hypothetical protein